MSGGHGVDKRAKVIKISAMIYGAIFLIIALLVPVTEGRSLLAICPTIGVIAIEALLYVIFS